MNKELLKMLLGSALRHSLTLLSGYLVSRNLLAPEHATDFITSMMTYAGDALPAIISLVWSAIQKSNHQDEVKQTLVNKYWL